MVKSSRRWMESSDVIPMFPTFVWKLQIEAGLRDELRKSILAALTVLQEGLPPLVPGAAWQSAHELHRRDDFRDLVACIDGAVATILRFLRIGDLPYEITGCWLNVLTRGAAHRMHSHPNNFLSGVYYARTSSGADTINFHDPRAQTAVMRPPVVELTAENTDQVVIRVRDGTLLMFPSYLAHSVDATTSDEDRVSVSFNVMFSSFTERVSKPLW